MHSCRSWTRRSAVQWHWGQRAARRWLITSTAAPVAERRVAEERQLLTFTFDTVAAHVPPLSPLKEVMLAVSLSSRLRKQLEQQRRHQRHQRGLPARRHGDTCLRQPSASGPGSVEQLATLFSAHVTLPAKSVRAHTLATPMTGMYVSSRYRLLQLVSCPLSTRQGVSLTGATIGNGVCQGVTLADWLSRRHSSAAAGAERREGDNVAAGGTFHTLWIEQGLGQAPVVPADAEVHASVLLERLRSRPATAGVAASADEVATLFTDVCVPFLFAFWGLTARCPTGRLGQVDPIAALSPACDSAWFQRDMEERLLVPLPWAVVESYLQLSRLPTAQHTRAALHDMLMGTERHRIFDQREKDGGIQLSTAVVAQLQEQLRAAGAASTPPVLSSPREPATDATPFASPPPPPPPPPLSSQLSAVRPLFAAPAAAAPPPSPPRLPSFDELCDTAQRGERVELVFHMAQAAMRAVFQVLLPALSTAGSGRPLEALVDRSRWHVRFGHVLGSLASFVEAFEDVFFTLGRRHALPTRHVSDEEAVVVSVSTYTGPVGPWLLYGRVVARFFPPGREVPLGVVAEALSWGLHFAPQFGDLPSLLAVVGRVIHKAVLLPVPPQEATCGGSDRHGAARRIEEKHTAWLMALHQLSVEWGGEEEDGDIRVPAAVAAAAFAGAESSHECAATSLAEAVEALPMLLRWDGEGGADGGGAHRSAASAPALVLTRTISAATREWVTRFVDTYVCPLLRQGVPHAAVALARELRLAELFHSRQHPVLNAFPQRCGSGGLSLAAMLWMYTACSGAQGVDEEGGLLWHGGRGDNAGGGRGGMIHRRGPKLHLRSHRVAPRADSAAKVVLSVAAATGQRSPQDCLLAVNGLSRSAAGTQALPALMLQPSEKPVSLAELVAQSDALRTIAAAHREALGDDGGARDDGGEPTAAAVIVEVEAVLLPWGDIGVEDVVVWGGARQ